jgi:DNA-binding CsgD family transcriptional regulator
MATFRSEDVEFLLEIARDATLGSTFLERIEAISDALSALIPSTAMSAIVLDLGRRSETPRGEIYYRNGRLEDLVPYTSHYIQSDPMLPAIPLADGASHLLSDFVPTRNFGRDPFTADYLKLLNVRHVMGCSHRMPNGQLLSLAIHRERRLKDFTRRERELLRLISPVITRAAFGALLQEQVAGLASSEAAASVGAVVFDARGEMLHGDPAGLALSRAETMAGQFGPAALRAAVIEMAKHRGAEGDGVERTYQLACGSWVRLRLAILGTGEHVTVLAILQRLAAGSADLVSALMDRGHLTPREKEIARYAVRGFGNRHIGIELGISPVTVNVILSHVYAKLGVSGRNELTSLLISGRAQATP